MQKITDSVPKFRVILTMLFYFGFYMLPLSARWFVAEEKLYTATNIEPSLLYPLNRFFFEQADLEIKTY